MSADLGAITTMLRELCEALQDVAATLDALDSTHVLVPTTMTPVQPAPPVEAPDLGEPAGRHPLRMSAAGKEFLAELEGVELDPYRDPAGIWTIGVGHVIRDGEEWMRGGITKVQALALLDEDVRWAEEAVHSLGLDRPLEQHELDALACFCFNIGARAFSGSTMARKLKAGDYACVPAELMRWVYYTDSATGQKKVSRGLQNRRRQTGELWSKGDYTVTW